VCVEGSDPGTVGTDNEKPCVRMRVNSCMP